MASSESLSETAIRAGGPRGESLPEDAQSLRHGEPDSVPDLGRQGAAAAAEADLPVHAHVLQRDSLLRELYQGADSEGGLVAVRHPHRAFQDQASRDVGHQDRARVDQGGDIRRHADFHASRIRTGARARSLQTFVDLHGDHVALLFGDGEGLRRDVPDDPGLPAAGSVGEHRESVRAGFTPLLYDRHVGVLQRPAVTVGLLEVPDGRHVSERVPAMEGTDGEFRRGAATGARGVEPLQEGDPRGDREVRRRVRGVSVRYDEGQGDTLPSSLPRGLPATMPEDQRQMSHVQARAQVRLNKRPRGEYTLLLIASRERFTRFSKRVAEEDEEAGDVCG